MRHLFLGSALLLSLSACGGFAPVDQSVPNDPLVFNGFWAGPLSQFGYDQPDGLPVLITSNATFIDKTTYKVSGTLNFRDVKYDFSGIAMARSNLDFHPSSTRLVAQYQSYPPSVSINADLSVGGQKVGGLSLYSEPGNRKDYYLNFSLDGEQKGWAGKVVRVYD